MPKLLLVSDSLLSLIEVLISNSPLNNVSLVATSLLDLVLTWRHHHRDASTSCCAHQHAAHLLPAASALTFSTIIRLLLINSLACSVCSISKPAMLSPGSLQQHRETRSQSLNRRNKQDRKCLRASSCRPEICHVP